MSTKINPKKKPRSEYDVRKAYDKGKEVGLNGALIIMLYTLKDKFGADDLQLQEFSAAFNYTVDGIEKGYVTVKDLQSVCKDEYGVECVVDDGGA